MLHETLKLGEADRDLEKIPRWQAGYDLAMGRVLATKVRTNTYYALLDEALKGLRFENDTNNTWDLVRTDDLTLASLETDTADRAEFYLQRVIDEHPDTPWAYLAQCELRTPFGWDWREGFTDLTPRPRGGSSPFRGCER